MNKYIVSYEGVQREVEASTYITARILGTRWLANQFGAVDGCKVAVVDVAASGFNSANERIDYFIDLALANAHVDGWCPNETVWARLQQEELDKVHAVWSKQDRRATATNTQLWSSRHD
jgi:hypothetical protein